MTLSEIETILEELASRHPNLTVELLTTMLTSAGWENKNIQDAVILFKRDAGKRPPVTPSVQPAQVALDISLPIANNQSSNTEKQVPTATQHTSSTPPLVVPLSKEDLTFYLPDGTEEGELHAAPITPLVQREKPKISEKVIEAPKSENPVEVPVPIVEKEILPDITKHDTEKSSSVQKADSSFVKKEELPDPQEIILDISEKAQPVHTSIEVSTPTISLSSLPQLTSAPEPESLIVPDEKQVTKNPPRPNKIPEDLPLIPFESSPHIWSFARYKNVFHKDSHHEDELRASLDSKHMEMAPPEPIQKIVVMPGVVKESKESQETFDEAEEVLIEKTPMTKSDESLVFLAGLMLLAIILILGYMYSNGRL